MSPLPRLRVRAPITVEIPGHVDRAPGPPAAGAETRATVQRGRKRATRRQGVERLHVILHTRARGLTGEITIAAAHTRIGVTRVNAAVIRGPTSMRRQHSRLPICLPP